jgi:hypothetical protein
MFLPDTQFEAIFGLIHQLLRGNLPSFISIIKAHDFFENKTTIDMNIKDICQR